MGQKLKNAPVYFTIAQVRFNPVLALDSYAAAIQENMRKQGFPDAQEGVLATFNLMPVAGAEGAPPQVPVVQTKRYIFANMERTAGFLLDRGALSFQTTDYDVFESFSASFLMGLQIVHNVIGLAFSERIGIRYLDAVFPKSGDSLSNYLSASVLGLTGKLDGELVHSFSETVTRTSAANVVSRIIIQSGKVDFPPDLQPMALTLLPRFQKLDGLHATIDTDSSFEKRETFDLSNLANRLSAIHVEIGNSFKATVTNHALKNWE
jgi:uncharacterized protein (TIGR04255 family)